MSYWNSEEQRVHDVFADLDRRAVQEKQINSRKLDQIAYLEEIQKCDEQIISDLQNKHNDLQNKHNDLQNKHNDLLNERDQLLSRVAELEKGVQEGGDLVE